jgi:hypothetical protein
MRNPQDNIWGIWQADNRSREVWSSLQNALSTYGLHLDIVYDDPTYPVEGRYSEIMNATG